MLAFRARTIAALAVSTALTATLTTISSQGTALASVHGTWRGGATLGAYTDSQGRPFNGVSSDLYVKSNTYADTGIAGDIFLTGSDGSFIQLGVFQGNFPGTRVNCTTPDAKLMTLPHLFLGYKRSGDACEALIDLGTFGVLGYRNFKLLEQADSSFRAYLDGTQVFATVTGFPASFNPGVVAEANDSCSFMYVRANTSASPYNSLQRKAAGDSSWHLWGAKSNYQTTYYASSYYEQNEPNPSSPAQFLFYGPNNPPAGDC